MVDWLERVPKVGVSMKLKGAITQHKYQLDTLKDLWRSVIDSRGIRDRKALLISKIQNGAMR